MGMRDLLKSVKARHHEANLFAEPVASCGDCSASIPFECREGVRIVPMGAQSVRIGHSWLRRR